MTKTQLFVIDHHPAIPPSDQLKKWEDKWFDEEEHPDVLLIQAFQAGADQELEACCEWVESEIGRREWGAELRVARRPKPPSLKEQAKRLLDTHNGTCGVQLTVDQCDAIRRALEQLDD